MPIAALQRFNAYRANPDPRTAAANTLALVLAYNGPCYPLYLYFLVGRAFWPSLIPLWAAPLFALVPFVARRNPLAGRVMLILLSTLNTVIYVLLFGARAELQLFLLPCIALGLFFSHRERLLAWALAAVPLALFVWLRHYQGAPIRPFSDAQYRAMATLSEVSVATLTWFMMVLFGGMVTQALNQAARPQQA
jgi:hypothetical protein